MRKLTVKRFFWKLGKLSYIFLKRWSILLIGAVFLTWYMQYRFLGNSADGAWSVMDGKSAIFWYSALIVFIIIILFYGFSHRPFSAIGVVFAIITILSYISNTKLAFRGMPLLPEDFQLADQAGTLTDFIDTWELVRIILAALFSVSLGFLLDYLTEPHLSYFGKPEKIGKPRKTIKAKIARRKRIAKRIIGIAAPRLILIPSAIFGFFAITSPIVHHDGGSSQKFDWLDGAEFVSWSQALNYEQNTFLLGFLYNLSRYNIEKPSNYSKETISKIKESYSEQAKSEPNKSKKPLSESDYNIVIVLNESFYDPTLLQEIYPFNGPDPLPTFHEIMKKYPSGYMYSPEYGGGTANVEFEVDTGLSNYWAQTTPYTSILPKLNHIISIANEAKAAGYETSAIHSYTGEMYKRSYVLPIEGFDNFITQDKMNHTDHDGSSGGYINDRSIYNEALDILTNSKKKQLIGVLTMQDHAPYNMRSYSEDELEYYFDDPNSTLDLADPISAYLQGVHYSDQYLGEFLSSLRNLDEKTVVLFFGDHAPGIFSYANTNTDKELADLTHLTPYFVWSNFETEDTFSNHKYGEEFLKKFEITSSTEQTDVLSERAENITLPTTTPNCLTNTMYEVLGLKKTVEGLIISGACQENPILAPTYLAEKQPTGKATEAYKLLNYDILNGKQYWF